MCISLLLNNISFTFSTMTRCVLEILPLELFHAIFNYFWADEILFTLNNITRYIDVVLVSYTNY